MFRDLGNSVSLGGQKLFSKRSQLDMNIWARMIELYGIFQSFKDLPGGKPGNPNFHTIKWKRKRKLEGWTGAGFGKIFNCSPAGLGTFLWCSGSSFPSIHDGLSIL